MTPLDYLIDAPFECGLENTNVVAFIKATLIIGGHDVVEEFLASGMWLLSEKFDFEVEVKGTPLSMVVVPMLKITPTIGTHESDAAIEARIVTAANLLVGNYNVTEHNAQTGLRHGWLIAYLSWSVCSASLIWSPLPVLLESKKLLLRRKLQCRRKVLRSENVQRGRPVQGIRHLHRSW
jgi:hypothetical protein